MIYITRIGLLYRRHLEETQKKWVQEVLTNLGSAPHELQQAIFDYRFGPLFIIADLIEGLALCLHHCGETSQGVTLLGAYFGIWPDDLLSLDLLGRRIDELGIEGAKKRLASWLILVGHADQEALLLQTFRAAFAMASERDDDNATSPPQIQPRWFTPKVRLPRSSSLLWVCGESTSIQTMWLLYFVLAPGSGIQVFQTGPIC